MFRGKSYWEQEASLNKMTAEGWKAQFDRLTEVYEQTVVNLHGARVARDALARERDEALVERGQAKAGLASWKASYWGLFDVLVEKNRQVTKAYAEVERIDHAAATQRDLDRLAIKRANAEAAKYRVALRDSEQRYNERGDELDAYRHSLKDSDAALSDATSRIEELEKALAAEQRKSAKLAHPSNTKVGTVYVEVKPDMTKFTTDLANEIVDHITATHNID